MLDPARLAAEQRRLAPEFDRPEHRAAVLRRLTLGHWWAQIEAAARPGEVQAPRLQQAP